MSIVKPISSTLSNLIAEANYTLENAKDKILAVYNYAVQNDNFSPYEARDLVEKKIVNVTNRYIRTILPDEAKQAKYAPKGRNSNVEQVPPQNEQEENENKLEDGIVIPDENRNRSQDKKIHITSAYDIQDVEEEQEEEEDDEGEDQERIWQFKYTIEIKGQDIPLVVTVYPDSASGKVEIDEKEAKRFNKRK